MRHLLSLGRSPKTTTRTHRYRSTVAVAGLLAVAVFAAGCSGSGSSDDDQGQGGRASAADSDPGATLRIATITAPQPWDPTKVTNGLTAGMYYSLVYDQLLTLSKDKQPEGELATEFEMNKDNTTLTLTIREGVTFHDGSSLDADAVRLNLERARSEGSLLAPSMVAVSEIKAPDPTTVVLRFDEPSPGFLIQLASDAALSSVVNPAFFDDPALAEKPEGSGPYELVSQNTAGSDYERVPDHWDTSSGLVAKIEYVIIADNVARLNAIRTGQVDVANVIGDGTTDVEKAVEDSDGDLVLTRYDQSGVLIGFMPSPPRSDALADPRVRQAISLAIDRTASCDVSFAPTAAPTRQLFGPGVVGHLDDLDLPENLEPDVDQAKDLMSEAGFSDVTLTGLVGQVPSFVNLFQILQQQLASIGITVTAEQQPNTTIFDTFAGGDAQFMVGAIYSALDPKVALDLNIAGGRGFGVPDDLVAPFAAAASQTGGAPRQTAYEDINRALVDEPYTIPVCSVKSVYLSSKDVVGMDDMRYALTNPVIDARYLGISS